MRPAFLTFLAPLALLAFAGCAPTDPLDAKVKAESPAEYNEWRQKVVANYPEELQVEIDRAFNNLAFVTPGQGQFKNVYDRQDPLCLQLNGRTVRGVIMDGYSAAATFLQQRISLTSDSLTRNIANLEDPNLDRATMERTRKMAEVQRQQLDSYRRKLDQLADQRKRFTSPAP